AGDPYPPIEASLSGRRPTTAWIEPVLDRQVLPDDADPAERAVLRESIRLAFVSALQLLPPRQRAVLLLREVLRWKADEVAQLLDTTVASVNSALQRARAAVDERVPEQSQQETLRSLGDDEVRELVDRYVDAWERCDVDAVVAMLTEDATIAMPPLASWYGGIEEVEVFLRTKPLSGEWRWCHRPAVANGQLAVGTYTWIEEAGTHVPFSLDVLTLDGDRIKEVTAFVVRPADTPDGYSRWPERAADPRRVESVFRRFGLPDHVD
ncbi:MAG: RNA polymerase subunit sigma-70, partial [Actinomycetota bacterium]|nr:RNA polymerase subunit sigma-70 [Actinomycetota bacterium]